MGHAFFITVITDRGIKNGLAVLSGDDPASGKGASVPDWVDFKIDGHGWISGPKKISMQAVCVQRLCNGLISGHQTLRDYLPAKNALLGEQAVADKGEWLSLLGCNL